MFKRSLPITHSLKYILLSKQPFYRLTFWKRYGLLWNTFYRIFDGLLPGLSVTPMRHRTRKCNELRQMANALTQVVVISDKSQIDYLSGSK